MKGQGKGKLGEQGEEEKPESVILPVPGIPETFDQEITHDRRGKKADSGQKIVQQRSPVEKDLRNVVQGHQHHCGQFDLTAAEYGMTQGRNKGIHRVLGNI